MTATAAEQKATPRTEQVLIGSLTARIPDDARYSDYLEVRFDTKNRQVNCYVRSTAAAGGMDTLGSGTDTFGDQVIRCEPGASPEKVSTVIRKVINNKDLLFKRYGKPTKNFWWAHRQMGFSISRLRQAMQEAS